MLSAFSFFLRYADMKHLVHTVVLDPSGIRIIAHQIIIFIVPGQPPWADMIPGPAMAQLHFLFHIPLKILETDLPVFRDGIVNGVHGIIDAFVHGLDPAGYIHLPLQLLGVIFTDQLFQLPDQGIRFLLRNKPGGLDGVHQELQFRQLKRPVDHMIVVSVSHRFPFHLNIKDFQIPEVSIDAFPVRSDFIFSQRGHNFRHGDIVFLIRIFQHDLCEPVQFKLLIRSLWHGLPSPVPFGSV